VNGYAATGGGDFVVGRSAAETGKLEIATIKNGIKNLFMDSLPFITPLS